MKRIGLGLMLASMAMLSVATVASAQSALVLPRISPNATVVQTVGVTNLEVTYSRPGVKGRVIWGGLVPYDKPWRTGANDATGFKTSTEITFGGQKLPAGDYSLFTIPTASDWTVVLSKQTELWGTNNYDESQDVLRLTVQPTTGEHVEWMRFTFENLSPSSADLVLRWEKLVVTVPIAIDLMTTVLPQMREGVANAKADDWATSYRAASWCFSSELNLEEAGKWLSQSLAISETYPNLNLKARWLAKDGKMKDAVATAKKAIEVGKANDNDTSALETMMADWTKSM
jgi:hypothetical protein